MNRRIVLARRPQGEATLDCFRLETVTAPEPKAGEVLLRTLYLSLDPYMRGRMSDAPSYAPPVALGEVMCGGTVCRVEQSLAPEFKAGDVVLARTGWQELAAVPTEGLVKLDPSASHLSWYLGVLGMPGLTAYVGLLDLGQPRAGDTVVVAAATGPVGSTVGQIAKLKGCRVVGIAGGTEKCTYAVKELGFDACIDHRQPDLARRLADACPKGIDVYFENVGGEVLLAVLPLLNIGGRVPVCGTISWYSLSELPQGRDHLPLIMRNILVKRLKVQGFIIFDHAHRQPDFLRDVGQWLQQGHIRYREDRVEGLEQAPQAFLRMLKGGNFGKLVVQV